ncbi:MAG: heavy-metal-associated domain-containing protein [Spirochaetaceae bacterium]|nr:MAG: heavy-metal-associated domain-containing protein [Spirochaetaceae bacterium]
MKTIFRTQDLSCPSCIAKIETGLTRLPGVKTAEVRFNSGRIIVEHDDTVTTITELQKTIRELGYEATAAPL